MQAKKRKAMLLKFNNYFNNLGQTNDELIEKYKFNKFDFDPEFVYESKDLKWFVDSLAKELFPEDKYEFVKDYTSKDGNYFIVRFKFCEQELKIYTSSKDDFIGGNYPMVLKEMNKISSSKTISTYVNMAGPLISGKRERLEEARKEGLAISLNNESIFWYLNSKNEKIIKEEEHFIRIRILDDIVDVNKLLDYFLRGYLSLKEQENRLPNHSKKQMQIVEQNSMYSIYIAGNSVSTNKLIDENQIEFDFKVAGKILAYGLLMTKQSDSVEIEIKNVITKEKENITKFNLMKQIEEFVK